MGLGGISMWQLLLILLIVVMVFGTKKLKSLGGDLGGALKSFRTAMDSDAKDGKDDPERLEQSTSDAEFAEQGPVATEELLVRLDSTMAEADRVLSSFDPARLGDTTDRTGKTATYAELILNQVLHFTAHTGQIVYATKLIQAGVIHEVWKTTPMQ